MDIENLKNLIERGATRLFVQTPEEFLYEFNKLTYIKPDITEKIRNILTYPGLPEINIGGFGTIYRFGNDSILKVTRVCPIPGDPPTTATQDRLCTLAREGSLIFRIINTLYNKETILCPNYFSEGIIGSILQNLEDYTPCFMKINGTVLDSENNNYRMYMIAELLRPFDNINSVEEYIYYLFQLSFTIYIAQIMYKYVHYDLHIGNIMKRPKDPNVIQKYNLQNGNFLYSNINFDVVIIDYGLNRMETKSHIIVPRAYLNLGVTPDALDSYEFNEYYDIISMLVSHRFSVNGDPLYENLLNGMIAQYLHINEADIGDFVRNKTYGWRAKPEELYTDNNLPMSPLEFVQYLSTRLPQNNFINSIADIRAIFATGTLFFVSDIDILVDEVYDIPEDPTFGIDIPQRRYVKLIGPPGNETENRINSLYYDITTHKLTSLTRFRVDYSNFNRTRSANPDTRNQVIDIAEMFQPSANPANPFRFFSDCCRLDVRTYFQDTVFEEGIAINASFFNIFTDFKPIGLYKTGDTIIDNPLPVGYEDYYHSIVVDNLTGDLNIISIVDARRDINNYNIIITAGPMLIYNENIVLTEDDIRQREDANIINDPLQCRNPQNQAEMNDNIFADGLKNCSRIVPGQFSHAGNQNPRTIVAIGRSNNTNLQKVYFIIIEGRSVRGDGMDLAQSAQFLTSLNRNNMRIEKAINLDGGGSSSMTYLNNNVINIINPGKNKTYMVGNILCYARKEAPFYVEDFDMDIDFDDIV